MKRGLSGIFLSAAAAAIVAPLGFASAADMPLKAAPLAAPLVCGAAGTSAAT